VPNSTCFPLPRVGQGDVDCTNHWEGGGVTSVDALAILVHVAGKAPLPQNEPCPSIGRVGGNGIFGDVDCDGGVTAVDALADLRHVAGMSVNQHQPCPQVGDWPATGS
jgi:hypothetical protein